MNSQATLQMFALLQRISDEVDIYRLNPEDSLFSEEDDDPGDLVDRLEASLEALETAFPMIQIVESYLDGDISPAVFRQRWSKLRQAAEEAEEEQAANTIGPEVTNLLSRTQDTDGEPT